MDYYVRMNRLSETPVMPREGHGHSKGFTIETLFQGPMDTGTKETTAITQDLGEKLRQAYFWITNKAIINPFFDIEYNREEAAPLQFPIGDQKSLLTLPSDYSFSSFVLLPLLTLITRRKCLLIGGPGRGKTASSILMGLIAGYDLKDIKRAIQHGQPQMTISDLLGNPLPSDLMKSESMDNIRIAWRKWLDMKVKIIDEYNRIPTRTQSALLTVMSDNYAEMLDQIHECPDAAWYLTANDDAGGGTYQVIEALKDRIDVVVRALHFNTRFIGELLERLEAGASPEKMVPKDIIFTAVELDKIYEQVMAVRLPPNLLKRMEYFASQFELLESAGNQMEYKTKDNVKVSAQDLDPLMNSETGKDKIKDMGYQTLNGLSVRAIMTCLVFAKALAYFRGVDEVTFQDIRHVLPFVLHDKLVQNPNAPFFEQPGNGVYRVDKVSWIRFLFDESCRDYDRQDLDKHDPIRDLQQGLNQGLKDLPAAEARKRLSEIEALIKDFSTKRKLTGPLLDDLLTLKYLHQRYANYLRWLEWQS